MQMPVGWPVKRLVDMDGSKEEDGVAGAPHVFIHANPPASPHGVRRVRGATFAHLRESCLRSLAKESLSKDIYPSSLLNLVLGDVRIQ